MAKAASNTGIGAAGRRGGTAAPKSGLDFATIIGMAAGFALIIAAMVLGGSPAAFLDIPAICIVIGGTFAITTMCFSLPEVFQAQKIVLKSFTHSARDSTEAAMTVLQLAEHSRKQGILALQEKTSQLRGNPFLFKGIGMVIDGTPGDDVEKILKHDVHAMAARHVQSASMLRKAAEVSPAMGLIGTLVGLVQMLGNLDDPSAIGPSMAVALLTTFYGAVLANMVFSPLASKLERNSTEETLINNIFLMGAASIGRQENPRRLEMLLNTILPPSKRVQYFD